jgi:hypothetical protein
MDVSSGSTIPAFRRRATIRSVASCSVLFCYLILAPDIITLINYHIIQLTLITLIKFQTQVVYAPKFDEGCSLLLPTSQKRFLHPSPFLLSLVCFSYAVGSSDNMASNGRMISE